jgi:molybdate transport system substrate-binding protein
VIASDEREVSNMMRSDRRNLTSWLAAGVFVVSLVSSSPSAAVENLVVVASPSLRAPLKAVAQAFEKIHPEVRVQMHYETALEMRQMLSQMQNSGRHHIGSGPFHLIAPGGGEIITRLEQRYYILPGTRRPYAAARLVLVVPATLENAPTSFEELGKSSSLRVAIVDPRVNETGRVTQELLEGMGLAEALKGRTDIAHDSSGVLDHVLYGRADVGIVLYPQAYQQRDRVRVVAESPEGAHSKIIYEIAMERFCPNRRLCEEFMSFTQSPEAQTILNRLGYGVTSVAQTVTPPRNGAATGEEKTQPAPAQ